MSSDSNWNESRNYVCVVQKKFLWEVEMKPQLSLKCSINGNVMMQVEPHFNCPLGWNPNSVKLEKISLVGLIICNHCEEEDMICRTSADLIRRHFRRVFLVDKTRTIWIDVPGNSTMALIIYDVRAPTIFSSPAPTRFLQHPFPLSPKTP